MSKNQLTKDEMKVRVLKLKHQLENEKASWQEKKLGHKYLNDLIDILDEYRY
jgi:hypothetical protein